MQRIFQNVYILEIHGKFGILQGLLFFTWNQEILIEFCWKFFFKFTL